MKKIIMIGALTFFTITGCQKQAVNQSASLEDFYVQSLDKDVKEISLEDSKKALKEFEYEYELQTYSKEEKESYKETFGEEPKVSDFSSNTFIYADKNEVEILYNETNKEVSSISYTENIEDTSKKMVKMGNSCNISISTDNVESQREIMKRLNLSQGTSDFVNLYFDLVNSMKTNPKIKIDDIVNLLKLDYKKREDNYFDEILSIYTFENQDDGVYIDVEVKDDKIMSAKLNLGMNEKINYTIYMVTTNKDFNLQIYIMENLNANPTDKSKEDKKIIKIYLTLYIMKAK
ncbi:hypothetical protein [Faecalimicrobium dakarense]|uniref:hypothetical protein n=1 Tax=Faecalimicrobium dakarense TaxID=1301100 RepID=UPI0004BCCD92|nr:hypothetical protein [[Clostridium] dakarense]